MMIEVRQRYEDIGKPLGAFVSLSEVWKMIRLSLLFSVTLSCSALMGTESLLNYKTLRDAKEVELLIFNKDSGKPTCRLKYDTLQKKKPKLGPLTVNLDVLRLDNLHVKIHLEESTSQELFPELNRFATSRPFHFIDASPVTIQGTKKDEVQIFLKAGRAKFHRKGGFSLHDGVSWKIHDKEGQTPEARLVFDAVKMSWMLLTPQKELLSNFRF